MSLSCNISVKISARGLLHWYENAAFDENSRGLRCFVFHINYIVSTVKIYQVVSHLSDIIEKKNWKIKIIDDNKYELYNKDEKIGYFDVQLKKVKIYFISNQLDLTFNAANSKINNQNLKIIENNL